MTYQLTALFIVIILYFFSASFQTRWINFKLDIAADAERDIIEYMAAYEAKIEGGTLFKAWMDAMGLKAEKPDTPTFKTQYVEGKSE